MIIDAAGNSIMTDLLDRMETLIAVSRISCRQAHDRLEEIHREHIEIARAFLQGEGEPAAELMNQHFILTREVHLAILLGSGSGYGTRQTVNRR